MAETTTRPARARRAPATKTAPAKAAPKAAPKAAEVAETPEMEAYVIDLEVHPDGPTKSYARFQPPAGCGCVGTFYAPLGTEEVRVRISAAKV